MLLVVALVDAIAIEDAMGRSISAGGPSNLAPSGRLRKKDKIDLIIGYSLIQKTGKFLVAQVPSAFSKRYTISTPKTILNENNALEIYTAQLLGQTLPKTGYRLTHKPASQRKIESVSSDPTRFSPCSEDSCYLSSPPS